MSVESKGRSDFYTVYIAARAAADRHDAPVVKPDSSENTESGQAGVVSNFSATGVARRGVEGTIASTMMNFPLTLRHVLDRAGRLGGASTYSICGCIRTISPTSRSN